MKKKKLLQKGVAFSMLLPFSCGIALPAIESSAQDKPVVYAMSSSTYETNIDELEICLADTLVFASVSEDQDVMAISNENIVVSKVNLNVRSSPSTSATIVGKLSAGESATHVSTTGDWHKIEYDGGYAYVSASSSYSYVTSKNAGNEYVESLVNLNVRSSPSTSGAKVGMLYNGETALYIETNGSWHTIWFDGSIAYVSSSSSYTKIISVEAEEDNSESEQTPEIISKVVEIATSNLNVRSAPSTSGTIYGIAGYGEQYEYYETVNGWYKINYNGKTAYVSASYSTLKDSSASEDSSENLEDAHVLVMSCVNSLNVRSSPSTSSTCVGSLDKGDMVSFTNLNNGWYETVYKGNVAYVSASDVYSELAYFEKGSSEVEEAIELGCTLLGTPYVYGATRYLNYNGTLNSYFTGNSYDCSSMVQYIYASTLGIQLGSTSREQSLDGVEVAVGDIKRGDLLFFTNSERYYNTGIERIGHVAIYLGNNYILHTASDHAVIEEISDTRWKYFITARDVISSD